MKRLILSLALLVALVGCDEDGNYISFNRDALWNLSLAERSYCTFDAGTITNGMVFCHVNDVTTKNRIKIKCELTVQKVLEDNCYVVKIPYLDGGDPTNPIPLKPIVVKVLPDSPQYKVGDFFTNWGQYEVRGTSNDIVKSAYRPVYYMVQINTVNEHVFVEPFVDYGQTDR